MLYLLPQLPVKNRYTEDWIQMWERELTRLGVAFSVIGSKKVEPLTKYFTNPEKALRYECNQIKELTKLKSAKLLCLDTDFPGLLAPAIQVLKLTNPDLKCYGYLHAGSWCNGDIFKDTSGKKWMERAMFDVFDKIFVATNYHKKKIETFFGKSFKNIKVVGCPFYKEDVFRLAKPLKYSEKDVILVSGRPEQQAKSLLEELKENFGQNNDIIANPKPKTRKEYFKLLSRAKIVISLKIEETFGLSQLEAYALGGIPLCPNRYSYPEIIKDKRLLYEDSEDLLTKLDYLLDLKENPFKINLDKYRETIPKIIELI